MRLSELGGLGMKSRLAGRSSRMAAMALMLLTLLGNSEARSADAGVTSGKLANGAEVALNGIGEARELTGSLYLGALYLEHRSTNPEVIATSIWSKRLAIRITADKLYGRRFGQLWRERISINTDRKTLMILGKDIMQFVDLFKDTYIRGDQINIDYSPDTGTVVSVNGTVIGKVKNPAVHEVIIRAWVGDKPPTAQFKAGVLGAADDATAIALQQQFTELQPSAKRIAETRAWAKEEFAAGG